MQHKYLGNNLVGKLLVLHIHQSEREKFVGGPPVVWFKLFPEERDKNNPNPGFYSGIHVPDGTFMLVVGELEETLAYPKRWILLELCTQQKVTRGSLTASGWTFSVVAEEENELA